MKKITPLFVAILILGMQQTTVSQNWIWAEKGGSWAYDMAFDISTDASGYSYVTGYFQDTATFGVNTIISNADNDVFVAKYDSSGTCLWAKQAGSIGPNSPDAGYAISHDSSGNCYVTGFYLGTMDLGTAQLSPYGWDDMFLAKYDASGNLVWAERAGGGGNDNGRGISTDAAGNSYVTGYFWTSAAFGAFNLTSGGWGDIFTAKYDASGTCLWAKKAGGSGDNNGLAISHDAAGNSYVTGFFKDVATFDVTNVTSAGLDDIFIAKYDSNGNLQWTKRAGGSSNDRGHGIRTDDSGNSYVTGYFEGSADFDTTTLVATGARDIFIAKLDANGNYLWVEKAGGSSIEEGNGISLDNAGNCYITGFFNGIAQFDIVELSSAGSSDIFAAAYSTDGNILWAKQAGGSGQDIGNGIGTDGAGNTYVTGQFFGTADFDAIPLTYYGFYDMFIAKIPQPLVSFAASSTSLCINDCINFTDYSNSNPFQWDWAFQGATPTSSTIENPQNICYDTVGTFDVTLIITHPQGTDTLTLVDYITVDSCLIGINESNAGQFVSIFPNPNDGKFTLKTNNKYTGTIELRIVNVLGEQVLLLNKKQFAADNHLIEIDLSAYGKGMYFVRIEHDGTPVKTAKVIVR